MLAQTGGITGAGTGAGAGAGTGANRGARSGAGAGAGADMPPSAGMTEAPVGSAEGPGAAAGNICSSTQRKWLLHSKLDCDSLVKMNKLGSRLVNNCLVCCLFCLAS